MKMNKQFWSMNKQQFYDKLYDELNFRCLWSIPVRGHQFNQLEAYGNGGHIIIVQTFKGDNGQAFYYSGSLVGVGIKWEETYNIIKSKILKDE